MLWQGGGWREASYMRNREEEVEEPGNRRESIRNEYRRRREAKDMRNWEDDEAANKIKSTRMRVEKREQRDVRKRKRRMKGREDRGRGRECRRENKWDVRNGEE